MRELKFRAWIRPAKMMVDVGAIHWDNHYIVRPRPNDYIHDFGSIELMQYTGLKDKNGREIYEGDTVKTTNGNGATVKWNERTAGFILTPNPTRMLREELALGLMVTQIEVIGNIYETTEVTETP